MEINILIKKVEKKICDKIKCEKIIIEDKTFLHKKHKNFNSKKFHLKIKIESIELKSKKKIESNRYIFSIINKELKEYIHSIQLFIN
jgi:BolA protein